MEHPNIHQQTFTVSRNVFIMRLCVWIPLTLITFGIAAPILIYFLIDSLCTKLTLKEDGLHCQTGWLFVSHKHIPIARINNIELTTTPLGNWWSYAHLSIFTGNDIKSLQYRCIVDAKKLKSLLEQKMQ